MGLRDALSTIMGTPRARRIGPREAEQLLGAGPARSAYPELGDLLAAAAAPPRQAELAGLRAAVAAFEAAGQDGLEAADRRGGVRVTVPDRRRVLARSIVLKAAAGVAVVLFGGTALAAETGILPGAAQQHAHDVFSAFGVPPPGTPAPLESLPVRHVTPTGSPSFGSHAATPATSATPGPVDAAAAGLCRSWVAQQQSPKKKLLKAKALRELADAAGGADRIAAFCTQLLGTAAGETTASPTATHPGNAKGHSKATATPKAHKNG